MLCNRSYNNRINHLHERALRIVHNGNVSSVTDSLKRGQLISIHHTNIRLLGIELYKTRNNISCHVRIELFEIYSTITDHKQILQQDQLALLIMVWKVQDIWNLKFRTYNLILETLDTMNSFRRKLSVGLRKIVYASYVLITSITLDVSTSHIF